MSNRLVNHSIDPESFDALAELTYRESGLQLLAEKTSMIQSRLRHRLSALGVENFKQYADYVCSDDGALERRQMISALTTNVSHFFREQHHFDMLVERVIPKFTEQVRKGDRLRIWSAGCSNGQEAYSIAMSLLESYPEFSKLNVKILATDIDPKVVEFAKQGEYPERMISGIPPVLLKKYFSEQTGNEEKTFKAKELLSSHVVFKELNLLSEWPMKNKMDIIFCRNVVIYFDLETQNQLWPRFRGSLSPNGTLFLGHSERISDPGKAGFANDGPTSYRPMSPNKNRQ